MLLINNILKQVVFLLYILSNFQGFDYFLLLFILDQTFGSFSLLSGVLVKIGDKYLPPKKV